MIKDGIKKEIMQKEMERLRKTPEMHMAKVDEKRKQQNILKEKDSATEEEAEDVFRKVDIFKHEEEDDEVDFAGI